MRLLIEEALGEEEFKVSKVKALTGDLYDHYEFKHSMDDYCVVSVI